MFGSPSARPPPSVPGQPLDSWWPASREAQKRRRSKDLVDDEEKAEEGKTGHGPLRILDIPQEKLPTVKQKPRQNRPGHRFHKRPEPQCLKKRKRALQMK